MTRTVLDTNIIVSGLFWQGTERVVLRAATFQTYTLLVSDETLAELDDVLSRDKFAKLRAALGKTADQLVSEIQEIAELVTSAEIPPDVVRDPKDRAVLACAVGGNANSIVSGDKDLLVLSVYQNITILTAAQFLSRLDES